MFCVDKRLSGPSTWMNVILTLISCLRRLGERPNSSTILYMIMRGSLTYKSRPRSRNVGNDEQLGGDQSVSDLETRIKEGFWKTQSRCLTGTTLSLAATRVATLHGYCDAGESLWLKAHYTCKDFISLKDYIAHDKTRPTRSAEDRKNIRQLIERRWYNIILRNIECVWCDSRTQNWTQLATCSAGGSRKSRRTRHNNKWRSVVHCFRSPWQWRCLRRSLQNSVTSHATFLFTLFARRFWCRYVFDTASGDGCSFVSRCECL